MTKIPSCPVILPEKAVKYSQAKMLPDEEDAKCNLYHKMRTNSTFTHLKNSYGGIPENLVVNIMGATILLTLFVVFRKLSWKFLRRIVKSNEVDRWTEIFYSFSGVTANFMQQRRGNADGEYEQQKNVPAMSSEAIKVDVDETTPESDPDDQLQTRDEPVETVDERTQSLQSLSSSAIAEKTFNDWLRSIFTKDDDEIRENYGSDALQYLRFQRHIICYLIFVTIVCMTVILPLNFLGTLQGTETDFGHTTLVNLDSDDDVLWIHITISFLFFPVAIVVMRRFSVGVGFHDVDLEMSQTLMIQKIPKSECKAADLESHFHEAFPGCTVKKVDLAYDVSKLVAVYDEMHDAKLSLQFCRKKIESSPDGRFEGDRMYAARCSRFCGCFCACFRAEEIETVEFYEKRVAELTDDFLNERERALSTPVGIAFITFSSVNEAKMVVDSFKRHFLHWNGRPPASSLSDRLKVDRWRVSYASPPDDIYWENLSVSHRFFVLKYVALNVGLFVLTFFLTTPEYLVSQTDWLVELFGKKLSLPSPIVDFFPTILLWSFTVLLPLLVAYSDRFLGHLTRSSENHSIMRKTFWYLMFMIVLLPTFGFATAQASFEFLFNTNKNETYRWDCIFLPDSGAFFVNYATTAALIGAGLELIRFPDMFFYFVMSLCSRSVADRPAIQRALRYEFRFGEQYARIMLLFCMTMVFSVSCPLITPFGCLFFVTKYYVDRHNIFYAYRPSKINQHVHATAIGFVVLSAVMLQFFMTVYSFVRGGADISSVSLRSKYAVILFFVSVNIFSSQLWSETCKRFSPIEYRVCTIVHDGAGQHDLDYVPDILKQSVADIATASRISAQLRHHQPDERYGTFRPPAAESHA